MADLNISIYSHLAYDAGNSSMGAPATPPLAEDAVEINTTSTQSKIFPTGASFICIKPDDNCSLAFGEDPEADPKFHPVDAGERLWYGVHPGHRLAVIAR